MQEKIKKQIFLPSYNYKTDKELITFLNTAPVYNLVLLRT